MAKSKKIRILIVDDHPAIREGLCAIFKSAGDLVVCGEAEDGRQALASVKKLHPDLVLVDVSLRGENGIDLTRQLHEQWPAMPVMVLSLHEEQTYCDQARAAGARGYCAKRDVSDILIPAVRQILQGQSFVTSLGRSPDG